MQKLVFIIVSVLFAGTLAHAEADPKCLEEHPNPEVTIEYGDAMIKATPEVTVCNGGKIFVKLVPDEQYEMKVVRLVPFDKDETWLKKSVKASDLEKDKDKKPLKFKMGVPRGKKDRPYKYYVIVSDVGQLDPLVIVEN